MWPLSQTEFDTPDREVWKFGRITCHVIGHGHLEEGSRIALEKKSTISELAGDAAETARPSR